VNAPKLIEKGVEPARGNAPVWSSSVLRPFTLFVTYHRSQATAVSRDLVGVAGNALSIGPSLSNKVGDGFAVHVFEV